MRIRRGRQRKSRRPRAVFHRFGLAATRAALQKSSPTPFIQNLSSETIPPPFTAPSSYHIRPRPEPLLGVSEPGWACCWASK